MRAKDSSRSTQRLHLEILRLRIAIERQTLALHSHQLSLQLSPQHWIERTIDIKGNPLLAKGFSLIIEHPYLTSALASILVKHRWRSLRWIGLTFYLLR